MITVDVFFPALNRTYDFSLSESIPIEVLIGEMAEMISQIERLPAIDDPKQLFLCDMERKTILSDRSTLEEYEIATGSRLMLV